MAVTILEALQNAKFNFQSGNGVQHYIAMEQLNNAIKLLEKGYSINNEVEPLLEKHGDIDSVPDLN